MPARKRNDRDVTSTEELGIEEFEIFHGDIHGFQDTIVFLKSLERKGATRLFPTLFQFYIRSIALSFLSCF